MKKVFNCIIAISVLLSMATSCTDVLDKQAVDSFNQDVVFANINIVKAYLGKCYDRMGGDNNAGVLGMREDLLSSGTDQTLCIHRPSNYVDVKGTMSPDQLGIFTDNSKGGYLRWTNLYANIQNLNTILANIDGVNVVTSPDETLKGRLKGEAYFIRAYMYAQLMFVYGGVILVDQPFQLGQDFSTITRSSIADTKDFVLADIAQAITLLNGVPTDQGRATAAAAAALKSRLLLFSASKLTNGGWAAQATNNLVSFPAGSQTALLQAARDAAKEVMNGTYGTFSLAGSTADPVLPLAEDQVQAYAENYQKIFTQKGAWNSETIWGIQFPITGGNYSTVNRWNGPCGYHNWGNNNPTEPAVRSFEMADGTPFDWNNYTAGDEFVARSATAAELAADPLLNPFAGREPRFYAIVLYHGAPWQSRGDLSPLVESGYFYNNDGTLKQSGNDTRQGLIEAWNGTKTGYYLKKFMDPATIGQYNNNTNTWVEFRYAEILLNYAEACIELGDADLQPGLDALNMVRNRAGLPDRVTADQATARTYIRQERAIEFFGEGHRWYDTRRWMIRDVVTTNVYGMKVKQFDNGNYEWKLDEGDNEDTRTWAGDHFYWIPIPRAEINKAPQTVQNPGYN
ncbi:MAG TPA: RagB/SusD family nutrient uptake outer membrane protein [Bacteroidales bacterium]|nr:RagB/SusD family nutrient uptake outer membrane protein [Bacteroidales bacterium]